LEGTGSIVLDRANQIAYACLSERTDARLFKDYCDFMHYEEVVFHSVDSGGMPIYHTNVMMAVGTTFVVICLDSIKDTTQRATVVNSFEATGKEIIEITLKQMGEFAGNMLQVKNTEGAHFLIMSTRAYKALTKTQIELIKKHTKILHSDLKVIETYGGGSARCMMAEVFLPEKV